MGQFAVPAPEDAPREQATERGHPLAPGGHLAASLKPRTPVPQSPRPGVGSPVQWAVVDPQLRSARPPRPAPGPREPAPTSRGGAEERAAGGGAVVPGGELHAVAEDHPVSGGDGPARGLAAAAAPGHGLPRVVPAARTWPSRRGSLARPAPGRPFRLFLSTAPGICSSGCAAAPPASERLRAGRFLRVPRGEAPC